LNILSIIPARGGSKRIPKKNLLLLNDIPLIGYSILHSLESKYINKTVVSTDNNEIREISNTYSGVDVLERPAEISADKSTTEETISHVLGELSKISYEPDIVIILQVTSPLRRQGIIDKAINKFISSEADSLLSVTKNNRFIWHINNNKPEPLNYNYNNRPRTQEINQQFMENGSFYIFKPWLIDKKSSRLGGKIEIYEMDFWSSFEIDDREDYELVKYIYNQHFNS